MEAPIFLYSFFTSKKEIDNNKQFWFVTTVKPVLTIPCIQRLAVLSDRFHSSQRILLYTLTIFNDSLPYTTNKRLFAAVWKINPVLTDFHNCWYLHKLTTTSHSQCPYMLLVHNNRCFIFNEVTISVIV